MAIPATQIRSGMMILFEGEPCKVMEFRHHTPGNLRAMVQTKLRNIKTGSSFEHRFRSADTVERAVLEQHEMEFLYSDGTHHHFMNTENYEQVALSGEELGDAAQWLTPGLKIQAEFYEGAPIGIDLQPRSDARLSNSTAPLSSRRPSSWQVCSRLSRAFRVAGANPKKWRPGPLDTLRFRWRNTSGAAFSASRQSPVSESPNRDLHNNPDRTKPCPRNLQARRGQGLLLSFRLALGRTPHPEGN